MFSYVVKGELYKQGRRFGCQITDKYIGTKDMVKMAITNYKENEILCKKENVMIICSME